MNYKLVDFHSIGDERGWLMPFESSKNIPFDIKRVYFIYGTESSFIRGQHAHRNLEQMVICTSGSCDFTLDDGTNRETFHLNRPTQGLYIKNLVWREFSNFSPDCVLTVLASQLYDPSDYIRDYDQFLNEHRKTA